MPTTKFLTQVEILADFQSEFQEDARFTEFIEMRDLGFPIAYLLREAMVKSVTDAGKEWVNRAFEDLLELFGLTDTGWSDWWEIQEVVGVEANWDLPEGSVWEPDASPVNSQDGQSAAAFCSQCGKETAQGAKFCSSCGTSL